MTKDVKKIIHDIKPSVFSIRDISEILLEITDNKEKHDEQLQEGIDNIYGLANTLCYYIDKLESDLNKQSSE